MTISPQTSHGKDHHCINELGHYEEKIFYLKVQHIPFANYTCTILYI